MADTAAPPEDVFDQASILNPKTLFDEITAGSRDFEMEALQEAEKEKAAADAAAAKAAADHANKWHGQDGTAKVPTLRDAVKSGQISHADYYMRTGRIWAGAPQAKPTDAGTPGLDRLNQLQHSSMIRPATPGLDNLNNIQTPPAAVIPPSAAPVASPPKEIFGPFGRNEAQRQFATPFGNIGVTGGPLNPGGKISNNGAGKITQAS